LNTLGRGKRNILSVRRGIKQGGERLRARGQKTGFLSRKNWAGQFSAVTSEDLSDGRMSRSGLGGGKKVEAREEKTRKKKKRDTAEDFGKKETKSERWTETKQREKNRCS